jgi:hypothetical protein
VVLAGVGKQLCESDFAGLSFACLLTAGNPESKEADQSYGEAGYPAWVRRFPKVIFHRVFITLRII